MTLVGTAIYPYERRSVKTSWIPEKSGRLEAGPGTFRFEWPEDSVSCGRARLRRSPAGAHPTRTVIAGTTTRFEMRPLFAPRGRGRPGLPGMPGTSRPALRTHPRRVNAADQSDRYSPQQQYLPFVLETRVCKDIPQEALERAHVHRAGVRTRTPKPRHADSCQPIFGTEPGKCTMSLHLHGNGHPRAKTRCVASKAAATARPSLRNPVAHSVILVASPALQRHYSRLSAFLQIQAQRCR